MSSFYKNILSGETPRAILLLAGLFLYSSQAVMAQVTTADVVGTVTDNTGAVLPNAKVTITNTGTNIARNVTTDASGEYTVNLLPIGLYSVKVEASGFKSSAVNAITLVAGDRSRVDIKLEIGATSETVNITADANVLQTDSSTVGTAITGKLVQDLPLNGRNYIQLAQLVPGVSPGPANGLATGTRPDDRRLNSSFSVNGQDPVANNNMIDGMDNNERIIGTIGVRPSIDAIAEFKVQTNLYSAEISRTSGGVINILTKSGTNVFHGSVFEFVRNDKFDANGNYNFTAGAQLPKQKFRQNQYGGSVGGPIIKDRTFFFGDYEKLSVRQGIPILVTVPTAKQRIGDFSENCTGGFNAAGICATATQQLNIANSVGGLAVGAVPFNRLDIAPYSTLRDPIALKIAALYPLPNSAGINTANYAASRVRPQDATTFDARVDHRFNEKTNFFGRYSFNDVSTVQPTGFPDVNGVNPGGLFAFAGANKTRAQNIQLNLVRTLRPNLLLEVKSGYLRVAIQSKTVNDGKNTATDLGFPCTAISCVNIGDVQTFGLPRLVIQGGFQELGDAVFVPLLQFDNTFQNNAALTWTHGAHNVKFGGGFIYRQFALVQSASPRGQFTFNASAGNAPAPLNLGLANFIYGTPVTIARVAALYKPGYSSKEPGVYVQDDWRVNKWLTINAGLRYDIFTPKIERHDRLANFDPATLTVLVAGQNASKSAGVKTDHGGFAPRFGFAATLGHGMVLRGGMGVSVFSGDYTSGVALKNPPLTGALSCGPSITGSLTTTNCPAGTGLLAQGTPAPISISSYPTINGVLDLTKIPASSFSAVDLNFKNSKNLQFNLMLEKQLGNSLFSIGYIGSKGYDLAMNIPDINRGLPSGTATANPRPFAAVAPRVTSVAYYTTQGTASYNALQLSFNRRFGKGLSFTSGYTWAHGVDNIPGQGTSTGGYGLFVGPFSGAVANVKAYDHGTSDFNIKYRFSFGANYELPFGKNLKGFAGQVLGGWQANGILTWQTGLPFNVSDQAAVSGIAGVGANAERPNQVAKQIVLSNPTVGIGGQWLDPNAFAVPTAFTLGNSSRNQGYGPNQSVINASIFKTFKIYEGWNLQFRTEMFNVPNHPVFANPSTNTFGNAAAFGKITATAGVYTPRQIQFALKLLF
jgi:hypothetical protein